MLQDVINSWAAAGSNRPFYMGIGGGSASGKSTLAARMAERLAPLRVQVVGQDSFFKKPEDMPHYYSQVSDQYHPAYNEPDSFRQSEMFSACRALRKAECDVVILEGILVLWFEQLRALMDLKLYIEADADERIIRRIRRNMKQVEDCAFITDYYLESVRLQHAQYNAPTSAHADWILPGGMADADERTAAVRAVCRSIEGLYS
mgnify:FL=1